MVSLNPRTNLFQDSASDSAARDIATQPREVEGFVLTNEDVSFGPLYPPENLVMKKDRSPNRDDNVCEGESVSDSGGKNREVRITGLFRQRERDVFEAVLDSTNPFMLNTLGWSGEVRVGDGNKYRGPVGWTEYGELQWRYTLNLVSTGKHEYTDFKESGIVE